MKQKQNQSNKILDKWWQVTKEKTECPEICYSKQTTSVKPENKV